MNDDKAFERLARSWLEEGPTRAPDEAVEAALVRIEATRQEHAWPALPWSNLARVSRGGKAAWAVGATLVVVLGGALLLERRLGEGPGVSPTPRPSLTSSPTISTSPWPSPSASASGALGGPPVLTATFTSPLNRYTVQYPGDWTATSASQSWDIGAPPNGGSLGFDELRGSTARFAGASQLLPVGGTPEAWLSAHAAGSCLGAPARWPRVTIGGANGFIAADGCQAPAVPAGRGGRLFDAVVIAGGRAYDFAMDGQLTYSDFVAFLSTITLDPAGAVAPAPSP